MVSFLNNLLLLSQWILVKRRKDPCKDSCEDPPDCCPKDPLLPFSRGSQGVLVICMDHLDRISDLCKDSLYRGFSYLCTNPREVKDPQKRIDASCDRGSLQGSFFQGSSFSRILQQGSSSKDPSARILQQGSFLQESSMHGSSLQGSSSRHPCKDPLLQGSFLAWIFSRILFCKDFCKNHLLHWS